MAPSAGPCPFEAAEETIDGPRLFERRDERLVAWRKVEGLPDTMKDRPGMARGWTAADTREICVESGRDGHGEPFVSEAGAVESGRFDCP
jgi:hypothetical protein